MTATTPDATRIDADLRRYYAQRAASYEQVYAKPERQADLRAIEAWLPTQFVGRSVLEIACGTGWWTLHGARDARRWLATDANDEPLQIARLKPLPPPPARVEFRGADAYALDGLEDEGLDAAFAGHWWSHVPRARLPAWIATLHSKLAPGATVVMMDNRFVPGSSTPIARRDADGNTWQTRALPDGSTRAVLKNFPDAESAIAALGSSARAPRWLTWPHYWALVYTLAP